MRLITAFLLATLTLPGSAVAQSTGAPAAPAAPAVTEAEAKTVAFDCPAFAKNADGAWVVRTATSARAGIGTNTARVALEPGQVIAARTTRINGIDLWELINDRCR